MRNPGYFRQVLAAWSIPGESKLSQLSRAPSTSGVAGFDRLILPGWVHVEMYTGMNAPAFKARVRIAESHPCLPGS